MFFSVLLLLISSVRMFGRVCSARIFGILIKWISFVVGSVRREKEEGGGGEKWNK